MEENRIDLNSIDILFNPSSSNKRLEQKEIEVVYEIVIDMLPEDNILFFISILHSLKDDAGYVEALLKEDASASKGYFLSKILKALTQQADYKTIVVYDNISHIEDVEFQQFYFEEINKIKFILQEVVKKTIFQSESNEMNKELNKTIASILQQLSKLINLVISKKGQSLFGNGKIKETLIAISELVNQTSKDSSRIPLSSRDDEQDDILSAEIIDMDSKEKVEYLSLESIKELISSVLKESQESQANFIKHQINSAIEKAVETLVPQVAVGLEENFKEKAEQVCSGIVNKTEIIKEDINNLNTSMEENNELNRESHELLSNHIAEQQSILEKYKQKLTSNQ